MNDPVFKLQLLARAELTLTEIHARRMAAKSTYLAFALVLVMLGLLMLNLALFFALQSSLSPAVSALVLALGNGVLAGGVLLASRRAGPAASEEKLAREIREMAYGEVNQDLVEVKGRLESLASDVRTMGENINRTTSTVKFLVGLLTKK